jgi:hypothetical protein
MAAPGGLGGQGGTDDLGGVSQPGLAPRRQQHLADPARGAPGPPRPYPADSPAAPAYPPGSRPGPRPQRRGAAGAGQPTGGQVRLGLRRVEHDDHVGGLQPRVQPSYHTPGRARGHPVLPDRLGNVRIGRTRPLRPCRRQPCRRGHDPTPRPSSATGFLAKVMTSTKPYGARNASSPSMTDQGIHVLIQGAWGQGRAGDRAGFRPRRDARPAPAVHGCSRPGGTLVGGVRRR